ncbi:hypothetical protein [Cytobacillus horneckiae]|uniref:hypothetical protein n=1 Tax=Cytobacillus horneckiae TaxID=549687 RepID=UPI003D9A94E1
MRFNNRITFVQEQEAQYDPIEGKWTEGVPLDDIVPCNLSTLGVTRTNELFGQIDKKIIVARLQLPYNKIIDYVLIGEQKYQIKRRSDYRKGVFYLEGVLNG